MQGTSTWTPVRMFTSSALPGSCGTLCCCFCCWWYFPCWSVVGIIGCTGGFYMLLYAWVLNTLVEVVQASGFYMLFPGDVFLWLFPLRLGGSYARCGSGRGQGRMCTPVISLSSFTVQNTKYKTPKTKLKTQNAKYKILTT